MFESYLYIQRFTQTIHYQSRLLVPHWVEVFVDGFASEHLFTSQLELDIGITAAFKEQYSCHRSIKTRTEEKKIFIHLDKDTTLPPRSLTARLCPLFSSISSLYIPELGMARSEETPEEHGAPIPCQDKKDALITNCTT